MRDIEDYIDELEFAKKMNKIELESYLDEKGE